VRISVPTTVKTGLGLLLLGTATYFGVERWMSTRVVHPVDIPISLAKGHIRTGPFRLNLRTHYWVTVDPGQYWRANSECYPEAYAQLRTRWMLYSDGKILKTQADARVFTGFEAGEGTYELGLDVLSDGSCLNAGHPSLSITADTEYYEDGAFVLKALTSAAIFIGMVMMVLPLVRLTASREQIVHVTDSAPPTRQSFDWAQKLPLRRPISGLPAFGLYAGTFFALMAMLMMLVTMGFRYTPRGLWVHPLKRGVAPEKSDQWTDPLVVRVVFEGFGQEPKLLVNSKQASWNDLDHQLREELGRRREWAVYVEGDYCVAWANVASVIDIARSDGAKVILLPGTDEKECPSLTVGRPVTM
jgi:biopolymer transport protein ExbD